jgi:hypothetical protein
MSARIAVTRAARILAVPPVMESSLRESPEKDGLTSGEAAGAVPQTGQLWGRGLP